MSADYDDSLWVDRYRDHDELTIRKHLEEDQEMLLKLGIQLAGAGPGVTLVTPDGGLISANTAAWSWLRPLLKAVAIHAPGGVQ